MPAIWQDWGKKPWEMTHEEVMAKDEAFFLKVYDKHNVFTGLEAAWQDYLSAAIDAGNVVPLEIRRRYFTIASGKSRRTGNHYLAPWEVVPDKKLLVWHKGIVAAAIKAGQPVPADVIDFHKLSASK